MSERGFGVPSDKVAGCSEAYVNKRFGNVTNCNTEEL